MKERALNYYKINHNENEIKLGNGLCIQQFELERFDIFNSTHYKENDISYCTFCDKLNKCKDNSKKYVGICDDLIIANDWMTGIIIYRPIEDIKQ